MNFLVYNVPAWAPAVFGFALLPVYTAFLSPEDFGRRAVVMMAYLLLYTCTNLGLSWVVTAKYHSFDSEKVKNEYVSSLFAISFVPTAILFAIFFFLSPTLFPRIFRTWDVSLDQLLRIQLLTFLIGFCRPVFTQVMVMERRARSYSTIMLFSYVCGTCISLYLLVGHEQGISSLFYGELVAAALFALGVFFVMGRRIVPKFRTETIGDVLRIGLPAMPKSLFSELQQNLDKFILQVFLPINALGLYSKSQFMVGGMRGMHTAFSNAFSPDYIESIVKGGRDTSARTFMLLWFLLLSTISLGAILFLPDVFRLIHVNERFLICAQYAPLLGLQVLVSSYDMIYSNNIIASQRTYLLTVRTVISGTVNIALNLLLIPRIGIMGAILASLATYSVVTAMGFYFSEFKLASKSGLNLSAYGTVLPFLVVVAALTYLGRLATLQSRLLTLLLYFLLLLAFDRVCNKRVITGIVLDGIRKKRHATEALIQVERSAREGGRAQG